jgi:hypothetical protein
MKTKEITIEKIEKVYFCPSCHKVIRVPFNGDFSGSFTIECSCKQGMIKLKRK